MYLWGPQWHAERHSVFHQFFQPLILFVSFFPSYSQSDSQETVSAFRSEEEPGLCGFPCVWVHNPATLGSSACAWLCMLLAGALPSLLREKDGSLMQIVTFSSSQHPPRT